MLATFHSYNKNKKLMILISKFIITQDNKMDALVQQLDSYSRLGIPKLQHCAVKFEAEDAVEEGK